MLRIKVGRWRFSYRRGTFRWGLKSGTMKSGPGAYAGAIGPLFFTALRVNY